LRFAVGPFQPTAGDTRRAFEPFFAHLAGALGRPCELTVTTDWAGIAVALGAGQVDAAWMAPSEDVLPEAERARRGVALRPPGLVWNFMPPAGPGACVA
jgi:phosphonate transport system substrate-binding protein